MTQPIVSSANPIEAVVLDINQFLLVQTPQQWIDRAICDQSTLLLDHANCEYKAASSGMSLIQRYRNDSVLQLLMARLVREEMLHYEQILKLIERLGIEYRLVTASRYASTLHKAARTTEPGRMIDSFIIGAIIEARSCERFSVLYKKLPDNLGKYYRNLLLSEGRHYKDYLALAHRNAPTSEIRSRTELFLDIERVLIESSDQQFRFHSGIPES